ncbi:MAG: tetratricopeptide repeat protein [Woeseiaceae bacterium]|nr:tetratricopeptide repeat protein [Woeseiaceae bacterium]
MTDEIFKTGGGLKVFRESEDPLVGQSLGNYKVESLLAEGGMGRVYRGTRADGQFDRDVAIKMLPPGMGSEYITRFKQERQILASLSHPNIAQLFDAGLSESGGLFLVMELIDGLPIDEFSRDRGLGTKAKTRLMLSLSEALAFAHTRLVVHRDLKPSNVYVTVDGDLKLLDFGIAKILEAPDSVTVESRPMTPRYASPEQLLNEPISVASDIYQFGMLFLSLFEQRDNLEPETQASATERAVKKTSITAESRLSERLPAELDAIINKCLRAEPGERYASATDLTADLRNFLTGYPVSARNPGTLARSIKFVRRNWLPSAALALTFVSLLTFLAVTLQQQAATEAARASAERQQQRAEQVTTFLINLFESNNPSEALGEELSARDILERGLNEIGELDDEPELKIDLLDSLARVYRNLGDNQKALDLAEETLALKKAVYADQPLEIATTLALIARLKIWFGDHQTALELGQQIYEIRMQAFGADSDEALEALYVVGTAYQLLDEYEKAEDTAAEVLAGRRRLHGENHPSVTTAINNLAVVAADLGETTRAIELMEEVLAWNEVQIPADHPWASTDWYNYGGYLVRAGRYDEAIVALDRSLAISRKVRGEDHPWTGTILVVHGNALMQNGDFAGGLGNLEQGVAIHKANNPWPHPRTAGAALVYGRALAAMGRVDEAEVLAVDAARQFETLYGTEALDYMNAQHVLAGIRIEQGRYEDALRLLEPVIAFENPTPHIDTARVDRAAALRRLGRLNEADVASADALAFLDGRLEYSEPDLNEARIERALLLLDAGREDEAVTVIQEAKDALSQSLPAGNWKFAVLEALLAEAQHRAGQLTLNPDQIDVLLAELAIAPPASEIPGRLQGIYEELQ